jgi:type II secretory pathway component PulJ
MELLIAVVIVALVAVFVAAPLRRPAATEERSDEEELAELEIRKQVKYREIRDAESDHAAGKLSDEDFERLDGELRREAVEILKRMDRLRPD